jgi:hypothetical protein
MYKLVGCTVVILTELCALFFRNIVRVSHFYGRNRRKAVSEQVAMRNWNKQFVVTSVPGFLVILLVTRNIVGMETTGKKRQIEIIENSLFC